MSEGDRVIRVFFSIIFGIIYGVMIIFGVDKILFPQSPALFSILAVVLWIGVYLVGVVVRRRRESKTLDKSLDPELDEMVAEEDLFETEDEAISELEEEVWAEMQAEDKNQGERGD